MGCFSDCCLRTPKKNPPKSPKNRSRRTPPNKSPSSASQIHEFSEEQAAEAIPPTNNESVESPVIELTGEENEVESKDQDGEELKLGDKKIVRLDLNLKEQNELLSPETLNDHVENKDEKEEEQQTLALSNSVPHPPNYRYQNCIDSDYEYDDGDVYEGLDSDEITNHQKLTPCETSESLFSLSLDSRVQAPSAEIDDSKEEETTSNAHNLNPVLNPIENLSQWKAIKATIKPQLCNSPTHHYSSPNRSELSSNSSSFANTSSNSKKTPNPDIAVNTSLSSWLDGSDRTPEAQFRSPEERPILGALTLEELRQIPSNVSPRRSPTKWSPDDMPIIGTVGSYWRHLPLDSDSNSSCKGSTSSSKYGEDQRVKWDSTPFELRLEVALQRGVADF